MSTVEILWTALLCGVASFQAIAILVLMRKVASIQRLVEVGGVTLTNPFTDHESAPDFEAVTLASNALVRSADLHGEHRVLLFLSPTCRECAAIAEGLANARADFLRSLVIYWDGTLRECERFARLPFESTVTVLRKADHNVSGLYRVRAFPAAVLIDKSWRVTGFRYPSDLSQVLEYLGAPRYQQRGDGSVPVVA